MPDRVEGTSGERPNGGRDLARATAELGERLPEPLSPLAELAFNYRWSWLPDGSDLFLEIGPDAWAKSDHNPRAFLEAMASRRLRELAGDLAFVGRVRALAASVADELARPPPPGPFDAGRPIAYFCSEFAVHRSLPLYGGGLGVLAGDFLKAASDLALPLVGIGLLYRQGYFHQRIDAEGSQLEYWTTTVFERSPAVLVTDTEDRPLVVEVPIRGRTVRVQIWRVQVGRVPLYLLDTDREDNEPIDRWITARLYVGDRHTRLAQYAVLGIGGIRALGALGIEPGLVHLNEGHAALSAFERLRTCRGEGRTVEEALERVRSGAVFTTHTPVDAGNEWYTTAEIEPVLGAFAASLGEGRRLFYELGLGGPGEEAGRVAITPLALRTSRSANGVSRRHGEVARAMWRRLWPGSPVDEVPIGHVTNGVHVPSWMAPAMQRLLDRHLPAGWRDRVDAKEAWAALADVPDTELWAARRTLRAALVDAVRVESVSARLGRGEAPDYVEAAARMFDPDVLTIGFARRVAVYKRLHLLTRHLDRGLRLLANRSAPIQLVIAGKAHPRDEEAKRTLRDLFAVRGAPFVGGRIVFVEDYDLGKATTIVAGCDLWVNLPRPPLEASGTSGMKAALNGALNLSVLDGWWAEADDGEVGWSIRTPEAGPHEQDEHDARILLDILERDVIPLFYERDAAGLPARWLARVRLSMGRLGPRFSAARMLRDYVRMLYSPATDG